MDQSIEAAFKRVLGTSRRGVEDDYATVIEYARNKATTVDYHMRDKSFKRHVPHKTPFQESRHWGRDNWGKLDSLPREFRDMVNNDPSNPDEALSAAVILWSETEDEAYKAMDRLITYESTISGLASLPKWLQGETEKVIEIVQDLLYRRNARAQAIRAERAMEEAARRQRDMKLADEERRYSRGSLRTYYTLDNGTKLNDPNLKIIDSRGLPPHEYRRLLAESDPLRFKKHTYTTAPGWHTVNRKKQEEIDNKPPDKINPIHVKRGRNY